MIEKSIKYIDKDFSKYLKGLGLSEKEIKYILGENKRKNFEDGGSGDGGSSGGDGDSGPGGSDDGSSSGVGSGEGESTGDANDQGGTEGPGGMGPGAEGGFGIGPDAAAEAEASNAAAAAAAAAEEEAEVDMSMPAMQTPAEKAQAIAMSQMTPASITGRAIGMGIAGPIGGMIGGMIGSSIGRGVTGPSDDTQEQSSVQSGPAQSTSDGGGITTIPIYAPLYNQTTGDNTIDALIAMYRRNLGY